MDLIFVAHDIVVLVGGGRAAVRDTLRLARSARILDAAAELVQRWVIKKRPSMISRNWQRWEGGPSICAGKPVRTCSSRCFCMNDCERFTQPKNVWLAIQRDDPAYRRETLHPRCSHQSAPQSSHAAGHRDLVRPATHIKNWRKIDAF